MKTKNQCKELINTNGTCMDKSLMKVTKNDSFELRALGFIAEFIHDVEFNQEPQGELYKEGVKLLKEKNAYFKVEPY